MNVLHPQLHRYFFFADLNISLLPDATPPRCTGIIALIFLFFFIANLTFSKSILRFCEFISTKIGFKSLNKTELAVDTNDIGEVRT